MQATAVSDMEVALSWTAPQRKRSTLSHYHVYRGTQPDFQPSLLNLVQRPADASCVDRPQLHYGGWINNRLEPATTYYYRVSAVDRWNNEGPASPPVAVTTLSSTDKNMTPLHVECLRAILVSPLVPVQCGESDCGARTANPTCDNTKSIARPTAGFHPTMRRALAEVDADATIPGSTAYGHVPIEYRMGDYDHMMFLDETWSPRQLPLPRMCSRHGGPTRCVFPGSDRDHASRPTRWRCSPRHLGPVGVCPEYGVELAIDGSPDPHQAWISRPTAAAPKAHLKTSGGKSNCPSRNLHAPGCEARRRSS